MKNNIFYFLLTIFLSGTMCSCSLTEDPIDQFPENEAYKSPTLIYLNTVAFLYPELGSSSGGNGLGGADRGLYDLNETTSDEFILPTRGGDWYDGGLWQEMYKHQWATTNDLVKGTWDYLYRVIGKTNQSMDKLTSLMESDPSNEYYPVYRAEVQAMRALFYYHLLDLYGRVPLVTSSSVSIADVKQTERSEVYAFVIKELEEAIPFLSKEKSNTQGLYYGRMTRSVAYFLLAKLALNAEVYSDNEWWNSKMPKGTPPKFKIDGKEVNCWQATQAYCDSITALNYSLEKDYSFNFSIKNETSSENIFTIPMDPETYAATNMYIVRSRHYAHAKAYNQDGWNGASLTKDAYETFVQENDPRLDISFFTGEVLGPDGKPVMIDDDNRLVYKPEAIALDLSSTEFEKTAGARWKKYQFDENALDGGKLVRNDFVLFRYADVLLMKAEAKVRDGKDGSTEFMQVRTRVNADTKPATLENILKERLFELSWEGVRRQDLIRFGKFNDAISDRPESRPYRKVFPIPATVLELNKNLSQNNGY